MTRDGLPICPGCGWNLATADGYCLDCAAPAGAEEMDGTTSCPECGHELGVGPDCDECVEVRTGGHA